MNNSFWPRTDGDLGDIVRASSSTASQLRLPPLGSENGGYHPVHPFALPSDRLAAPLPNPQLEPSVHDLASHALYEDVLSYNLGRDDGSLIAAQKSLGPCDLLSRMVQISPKMWEASPIGPQGVQPPPILVGDASCSPVLDPGDQIPFPGTYGIKRRRSQTKKVVCIPAPTNTGSNRQSGDAIPSDLWAWRKYGQKPIKGSPYPRGYYRCSSSKGCSARKQVERSRTNPNMLVITYTSEHNHPWPTHRNALAGSTRSHASRNPYSSTSSSSKLTSIDVHIDEHLQASTVSLGAQLVKEEAAEMDRMPTEETHEIEHEQALHHSTNSDDFFADLGELGSESMDLIYSKELMEARLDEEIRVSKVLDPFSLFDWGVNSFDSDQAKREGL